MLLLVYKACTRWSVTFSNPPLCWATIPKRKIKWSNVTQLTLNDAIVFLPFIKGIAESLSAQLRAQMNTRRNTGYNLETFKKIRREIMEMFEKKDRPIGFL